MFKFCLDNSTAILLGICPPIDKIIPFGFSNTNITNTQWTNITSSDNFIEDYIYNSKVGHIFFNDHFYNDKYFDQKNVNPFDNIKNKEQFKIKIGNDDLGNPYYWGGKKC